MPSQKPRIGAHALRKGGGAFFQFAGLYVGLTQQEKRISVLFCQSGIGFELLYSFGPALALPESLTQQTVDLGEFWI